MKKCCHCKKELSLDCFQKNQSTPDGLQYRCKDCTREASKACRAKRGHLWKTAAYLWKKKNRKRVNECARRRRKANPEKEKSGRVRWALFFNYGITPEIKLKLIENQGGICLICKKPISINCATDHDHEKKCIRGMLCKKCNSGLGFFDDNIELLKQAAEYLEQAEKELNKEATEDDFKIATSFLEEIHGNTEETRSIAL